MALQIVLSTHFKPHLQNTLGVHVILENTHSVQLNIKSKTLTHRINHSLCVSHRRQAMHGHVSQLGLCLNPHKQDPP